MSARHPIISVTGSSGAGTTSVKDTFDQIFRRERLNAAYAPGDGFHRYDRKGMEAAIAAAERKGNPHFSHFGCEANLLTELEALFRAYGAKGTGKVRTYIHDRLDSERLGAPLGSFTPWVDIPPGTDLLLYEGLHGAVVNEHVDIARHPDLKIGVVPVLNLEWIQKIHRDRAARGYSAEAVMDTILRRMPDYVRCITPQFSLTDINFQRVPTVDTSNPFISRSIPTADESMVVIRFRQPKGIDFAYLTTMIHDSFMSRANSIVIPGGKLDLAMQLILTPLIMQLMERKRRTV